MDKVNQLNKLNMPLYGSILILRFITVFISISVATNVMSQIYIENVLVNDLDPPPLSQFVWTFALCNICAAVLIYGVVMTLRTIIDVSNYTVATSLIEHCLMLILALIILFAISSTMYSKKYFLYKDDGLRAIRALSKISKSILGLIFIIPIGLAVKGSGILDNMFI